MDEVTLKRATEPFFTTKGAGRGTGLGLSMVDGLVAQSGGTMRITSRPGLGTLVELFLPVSGETDAEWPVAAEPVSIRTATLLPHSRRRRRSGGGDRNSGDAGRFGALRNRERFGRGGAATVGIGSGYRGRYYRSRHARYDRDRTGRAGAQEVAQPADCDCHRVRANCPPVARSICRTCSNRMARRSWRPCCLRCSRKPS